MKCPKCDSKMKYGKEKNNPLIQPFYRYLYCKNCEILYLDNGMIETHLADELNKKIKYQQRLDKVLSKFERNYLILEKHTNGKYELWYNDKKFYQVITMLVNDEEKLYTGLHTFITKPISLETVEHIIKDIEDNEIDEYIEKHDGVLNKLK